MIFAGIAAGGRGFRLKSTNMPKQFLEIGGEPIIIKTVKQFLNIPEIDKIYIGIKSDWYEYMIELVQKFNIDKNRLKITNGGCDRNETIMEIMNSIKTDYGWNKGDIILTHDAVRPFVSKKIIMDNISCAKKFFACGTYVPAVDTIVASDGKIVEKTLDRSILYQAQTPQSFEITCLAECFNKLSNENKYKFTDTCSILSLCGKKIYKVAGDPVNFKITTDNDLLIAKVIAESIK